MTKALLAALIGLAAPSAAAAQAISVDTLKSVTKELASDAFEGRAPSTPGEDRTVAYLIEQMKAQGLKPGNRGEWTQAVPIVRQTLKGVTPMHVTGGEAGPLDLKPEADFKLRSYRIAPRIEVKDSEVVFAGYGITAPEKRWDDYAGIDVRGKTVIVLVNDPDWQTPTLKGPFGGREMTYYGRWTYKYEEAARRGAAALLIVHDTEPAAYPWEVVSSVTNGLILDSGGAPAGFQSDVDGWLHKAAAQRLLAAAGQDLAALSEAAKRPGFRAVPLGLKLSVAFGMDVERTVTRNVVGIQPGGRAPDEYVLYTAHWDHFGRCAPVKGDDICNGAVDNATGVAALLALAEANRKAGPARRSQVFIATTLEEYGLLGAQYYAEHPIYPLAKTVGGVNIDVLSLSGATRDFAVTGAGKSELEDMVKPFVAAQGRRIVPEPEPEKGFYFRADHFNFAKVGVPMFYGSSGADLVRGGRAAGLAASEDYNLNRYHKPQDEYRGDWDWSAALQDVTVFYRLGRQLADGTAWPNWRPTSEFRQARDASRRAPN